MTLSLQDVYAANILDTVCVSHYCDLHPRALLEEILPPRIELKDSELRQRVPGGRGASSFVTKPVTFEALVGVMKTIGRYWFEVVELPGP